jgi:hypothetical protein
MDYLEPIICDTGTSGTEYTSQNGDSYLSRKKTKKPKKRRVWENFQLHLTMQDRLGIDGAVAA